MRLLELTDLSKRYGEVTALDRLSFVVQPGRMMGFLGPNGAGKTTTMRAIFGLVRLDGGSVRWDGRPVGREERMRFGYMPEERGLYPKMRIGEQLTYYGRLHGLSRSTADSSARTWLDELGLTDRAGDRLDALSHGNQQRVQLAAALIHDPELLILDEPFAGLDPIGAETMSQVLRRRAADGAAVVFSSHQLDLVEDLCEDVAIVDHGRVVLSGNVRRLKDGAPVRVLELETEGTIGDLADRPGVRSVAFDGFRHRLIVDAETDARALLSGLDLGGAVRHFAFSPPSLSDLFREAVA